MHSSSSVGSEQLIDLEKQINKKRKEFRDA